MILKKYQRQVINDLESYLGCVEGAKSLQAAWHKYLNKQGLTVGDGVPEYQEKIAGVPDVCLKIPTGGGKTFLACVSLQKIFRLYLRDGFKFVVWLVPSDSILTQTVAALSNPNHPYRAQLDKDFEGHVAVYTKEMLLQAQNFSPASVEANLSICVLSYASVKIHSDKKDMRKAYQENGNLQSFVNYFGEMPFKLPDAPPTALINVLREMAPLIIVDESHNATSKLSREMLATFNPSFILELTATPKESSNVIACATPKALKAENMVKLPVIVFNKDSEEDVISSALKMRSELEHKANQGGGRYIRPIILFQAQPNTAEDSTTFNAVKEMLVERGIPAEEIAIKTSTVNELNGVDLLSPSCKIRHIITVNALKEGWDCPFAYILASLANRNSQIDVEQIVGRILRQPYAQRHGEDFLNASFVFTCSKNFYEALDKIVEGMEFAGFTRKECRVAEDDPIEQIEQIVDSPVAQEPPAVENIFNEDDDEEWTVPWTPPAGDNSADIAKARQQVKDYEENQQQTAGTGAGVTVVPEIPQFEIREEFRESVSQLKIPQFVRKVAPNIFGGTYALLERDNLMEGFKLSRQDANVTFSVATNDLYSIDIAEEGNKILRREQIIGRQRRFFMEYLTKLPPEKQIHQCTQAIAQIIGNKDKTLEYRDILAYVSRIVEGMSEDELKDINRHGYYASVIQKKIKELKDIYRRNKFREWLNTNEITCRNNYRMPPSIRLQKSDDSFQKSLYTSELGDLNGLERLMVKNLDTLANIKWWHRNIERHDFRLNAFINHYPDFLVMTANGNLLLVETKGDFLDGNDSQEKLSLGHDWQIHAGGSYRYFMVFEKRKLNADGAVSFNNFVNEIQSL